MLFMSNHSLKLSSPENFAGTPKILLNFTFGLSSGSVQCRSLLNLEKKSFDFAKRKFHTHR